MGSYRHNNGWRKRNPEKRRLQRKRNYDRTRKNGSARSMQHWTPWKLAWLFLMTGKISDRDLSRIFGRSVQSIQCARWRWKDRLR